MPMPMSVHDLANDLSGLAIEIRRLAYTGSSDKEHALLDVSRRLGETAWNMRRRGVVAEDQGAAAMALTE